MSVDELLALIAVELKDDLIASIIQDNQKITVLFTNGTQRIITVK